VVLAVHSIPGHPAAYSYFAWAGPGVRFFGMGTAYFARRAGQGRRAVCVHGAAFDVAIGGFWLASTDAPAWTLLRWSAFHDVFARHRRLGLR